MKKINQDVVNILFNTERISKNEHKTARTSVRFRQQTDKASTKGRPAKRELIGEKQASEQAQKQTDSTVTGRLLRSHFANCRKALSVVLPR